MTDKGLRKAVKGQTTFRLPSNFTYRMMQQVNQEALAREKREERRWFIIACVVCTSALACLIAFICITCKDLFARWEAAFSINLPDAPSLSSLLPILVSLLCLCGLYGWLEKKAQTFKRR